MFANLASKLFGFNGGQLSKLAAKNRLEMVLVQDRSKMSAADMESFREELVGVISRYFVLEKGEIEVEWQRRDDSTALIINTPVIGRCVESKVNSDTVTELSADKEVTPTPQ